MCDEKTINFLQYLIEGQKNCAWGSSEGLNKRREERKKPISSFKKYLWSILLGTGIKYAVEINFHDNWKIFLLTRREKKRKATKKEREWKETDVSR